MQRRRSSNLRAQCVHLWLTPAFRAVLSSSPDVFKPGFSFLQGVNWGEDLGSPFIPYILFRKSFCRRITKVQFDRLPAREHVWAVCVLSGRLLMPCALLSTPRVTAVPTADTTRCCCLFLFMISVSRIVRTWVQHLSFAFLKAEQNISSYILSACTV